ncbi:MAG: HEAT repeat domain-containing protein [Planctomycetota bacterium]|nr:HEAT repeat domain-containing protein [Planctomycetota bacterium]
MLSLQKIGLNTPKVVAAIEKEATGHNRDNRRLACRVLGEMGVKESAPILQKALKDDDWLVRWAAREAIEKLHSKK